MGPFFHVCLRLGGRWDVVREETGVVEWSGTEQWRALEVARRLAHDEDGDSIVRGDSCHIGPGFQRASRVKRPDGRWGISAAPSP